MLAVSLLERESLDYQPGQEVSDHLARVGVVMLIGPSAVGKSVLIDYTVDHNPDFGRSRGFTTRPIRPGESLEQYDFMNHDEETVQLIRGQLQRGELVQIKIHPHTKYIYGSDANSYAARFTLLDVMASAVDSMRRLPFKSSHEFSVACEASVWETRFNGRGDANRADAHSRIREGVESLEWSLEQGTDAVWLDVTSDLTVNASTELVSITHGLEEPNPLNRRVGERLLNHLKQKLES